LIELGGDAIVEVILILILNYEVPRVPHLHTFPPRLPAALAADGWIPLDRLVAGQRAVIRRVLGPAKDVHRLEEFGLRPDAEVQMFRPGNPCILRLAGSKVCLRADGATMLLVAPVGPRD